MLRYSGARPLSGTTNGRATLRKAAPPSSCCADVRSDTEADTHVGRAGWIDRRRAPCAGMGRRALPSSRRGSGRSPCPGNGPAGRARRRARRDQSRPPRAVAGLEGPLRPSARTRARALLETARDRRRHRVAQAPDRRARRDADRDDRGEPAPGRGSERQRQRPGRAGARARGCRRGGRARGHRRGRRGRGRAGLHRRGSGRGAALPLPPPDGFRQDDRGRRLRRGGEDARDPDPHPPPPARLPVPARSDHRGLRRPLRRCDRARPDRPARGSDHDPDLRLVRPPRRLCLARRLPARDLRRGAHGPRREDERGDPQLLGAALHRHDRDRAADREAGLRRLPRLGRRPAADRCGAARADRTAPLSARPAGRRDQRGADRRRRLRGTRPRRRARPPGA